MSAGVSRVLFTEDNDARPTYYCAGVSTGLFTLNQVLKHTTSLSPEAIYLLAALLTGLSALFGVYCIMGCIWHPIPIERRNDGRLTMLKIVDTSPSPESFPSPAHTMFSSLDDHFAEDVEEAVDASQVEVRNTIQWRKMTLTVISVGFNVILTITFGR